MQDEESGKVAPSKRSVTDSAYQSLVSLSASLTISTGWSIGSRGGKSDPTIDVDLKCFDDLDPDNDELDHFYDIRLRLKGKVARIVQERHPKSCVVQAMMIGKSEADAKLYVTIFCSPRLRFAMNEMFASQAVSNLLRLPGQDRSLGYLVIHEPPSPIFAQVDINMCCQPKYASTYNTYCGAPVIFKASASDLKNPPTARLGTIGGIVQVMYPDGKTKSYAMTAGHVVNAVRAHVQLLSLSEGDTVAGAHTAFDVTEWIPEGNILGEVLNTKQLPDVSAGRAEPTHDWALCDVHDPQPNLTTPKRIRKGAMNLEIAESQPITTTATPDLRNAAIDSVLLLGSVAGTRQGGFSKLPADIWLEDGECFVDSYVLKLATGNGTSSAFFLVILS
jgi:hypothetical protein